MKAFKLFSITISALITGFTSHAQTTVNRDPKVDQLVKNQSQIFPPSTVPQINGYRLQINMDSEKATIDSERSKFVSLFPKVDTYVEYSAPNYFLKVGDFRTLMEVEGMKAECLSQFPMSMVIKERINLPRIDQ
jgi:hypothetical protein